MQVLGIAPFDLAVIGILLAGALSGLVMGFVRGGLFVLSWAGAGVFTVYGFDAASPYARRYIEPGWLADLIGGAVLFIGALIVLHLISQLLSRWVRRSRLNALDRSLGLLAGIVTAAVAIAVTYLFLSELVADERPQWLEAARTRPLVESAAVLIRDVLPEGVVGTAGAHLRGASLRIKDSAVEQAVERLSRPPETSAPASAPEYKESERQELDRLIQKNQ